MLGLRPGRLGRRPCRLGLRPGWMAQRGKQIDGQTNRRKIVTFYRPLSLIRAAALLPLKKTKKISFKDKSRAGQGNR